MSQQKKAVPILPQCKLQVYERTALVLQGGGSLGAYQVGACQAIYEQGYRPDWIAGISIGAINAAIIAGNPPENCIQKLKEFWKIIVRSSPFDELFDIDFFRAFYNKMGALSALMFGQPNFFVPRWVNPWLSLADSPDKMSYYDVAPLRNTLENLVDFDRINSRELKFCLGATNIKTGQLVYFDNQATKITVDHVLASAALPPAFPAVEIDGELYWDGGVFANTPLLTVLDALPADTLCFMIDCFDLQGKLPATLDQVEERQKDIRFASHSRRNVELYATRQNFQRAIAYLGEKLTPEARHDPEVQRILRLGKEQVLKIVHIIYQASEFAHSFKDYNFSKATVKMRMNKGYTEASAVLADPYWKYEMQDIIYSLPEKPVFTPPEHDKTS